MEEKLKDKAYIEFLYVVLKTKKSINILILTEPSWDLERSLLLF